MSYMRYYFEDQKPKYNNKTKRNTHKFNGVWGSRPTPYALCHTG